MKESNNTEMNNSPSGAGDTLTHYQQLPIEVKLSRLQVQPLIEKITRMGMLFHYKRFVLARQ